MTSSIRSVCIGAATAALALGLGACNQTTYGTGTAPGMQTLEDLAGIADMGGQQKDPIDYKARPKIVAPPPDTPLPAPGSNQQDVAANWPNDPDAQAKQYKQRAAALEKYCAEALNKDKPECHDPGWRLPPSAQADTSRAPSQTLLNQNVKAAERAHSSPEQDAQAKKLFADARGQVAVDESGKPIRRYLTDPPSEYREPDPNAPVEIDTSKAKQKKKWKWPWE
jgi:hypothetical protein